MKIDGKRKRKLNCTENKSWNSVWSAERVKIKKPKQSIEQMVEIGKYQESREQREVRSQDNYIKVFRKTRFF